MTGREWVAASLRLLGVLAPGETPAAQEATDGLAALNRMLSSWSLDELLIPAKVREVFTLTASDGSYTMGSSGDFNTSRPVAIENAAIRDESVTPAVETPIAILTKDEWAAIPVKEIDGFPTGIYPEGTQPTETINIYPRPTAGLKLVLYSRKELTQVSTLDTVISVGPGVERAMIYNGSVELAPEYGKSVSAEVAKVATDSLGAIMSANHRPNFLSVDPALLRSGSFNMTTGE